MKLKNGSYELELFDEPTYTSGSADILRSYSRTYALGDPASTTSRYGVVFQEDGGAKHSCMLLASGGPTAVHERSAVIVGDRCFVAVGDTLCALALPSLELLWHKKVDTASCFGVYWASEIDCLISHGECEITRLSLSGHLAWSTSGGDIFTEAFELHPGYIEATDFNHFVYRIDLTTGEASSK